MNPIISPFSLGKDISYDVLSWNLHGTEPMSRPQSEAQAGALTWDPFHATGRLQITHNPPYNTGSHDFIYDDSFVDNNDCFTHSKWLSFLNARLSITRQLLSDQGVIFISIDDHEEAALKLLCDGLFTEDCFVANIAWQRTYSTRNDSKGIGREVEHILVYSKRPNWTPNRLPRTKEMDEKYKNPDNDIAPWRTDNPYAPSASTHQGMVYAIQHPFTGKMLYPTNGRCWPFEQEQILEIIFITPTC